LGESGWRDGEVEVVDKSKESYEARGVGYDAEDVSHVSCKTDQSGGSSW
jgi:hypothetical protein